MAGRAQRWAEHLGDAAGARPGADHAQKKSLLAAERDAAARAAWRAMAAARDPADLVFLDETATPIAMTPRDARAPRGTRVSGTVPRNHGQTTTRIAALSSAGVGAAMTLDGAADGPAFTASVRAFLVPTLRPGQGVILDNLAVHQGAQARACVEARGCRRRFLPASSPDLNPIELAFAKFKEALRRAGARTKAALEAALATALAASTTADARGWFAACGSPLDEAHPFC